MLQSIETFNTGWQNSLKTTFLWNQRHPGCTFPLHNCFSNLNSCSASYSPESPEKPRQNKPETTTQNLFRGQFISQQNANRDKYELHASMRTQLCFIRHNASASKWLSDRTIRWWSFVLVLQEDDGSEGILWAHPWPDLTSEDLTQMTLRYCGA